ncbi:hypothetical protein [Mycolicibacterium sp. XJ1819]
MFRHVLVVSWALLVGVALPLAPAAAADDGQTVITQSGMVRCAVSADNVARGGGSMVVCQRADGHPFGQSPWAVAKHSFRLPVAVVRGAGQFYWAKDPVGGAPGNDVVVEDGQSHQVAGWTIRDEGLLTRFTDDVTGHGLLVNAETVRQF